VIARALVRWQKQLSLFPEEVAATLGELMHRLAPALDALTLPRDSAQGEVDGFDGIARRGSYERLLPSEWLLRESVPLEFLRRASQAEHSFFQLARRESTPTRASLALFDAGPDQLGACRLAQLALLLLLSQQAELRGETLNWQHLHHVDQPPLHTLDEHSVRAFLDGRTARRCTHDDLQDWRARFPDHERWLIGSRRLLGTLDAARAASTTISIHERVAADAAELEVRFSAPGKPPCERTLQLPEPDRAARLLRNPFELEPAPHANAPAPRPRSNLVLNPSGTRLYYLNERGQLVALAVPNSASAHAGTARTYQSDNAGSIIGVAGQSGRQHWLCTRNSTLTLRSNGKEPALVARCSSTLVDQPPALWPMAWFSTRTAVFVAPDRSLWRADFGTGRAHVIGEGVRAFLLRRGEPFVALDSALEHGDPSLPCVLALDSFKEHVVMRGSRPWRSVFLDAGNADQWLLGFEEEPGRLRIQARKAGETGDVAALRESVLYPPAGQTVVAVDSGLDGMLGFVSLSENRRRFSSFTRNNERKLFDASSAVADVVSAGDSGAFAFVTIEGELGVLQRSGKHCLQRQLASS
jgi:hypothetical protein